MMIAPDPRAFACHKLWLADRDDRDAFKRRRDRAQAAAIVGMLARYRPDQTFEDSALDALPQPMRQRAQKLFEEEIAKGPSSVEW